MVSPAQKKKRRLSDAGKEDFWLKYVLTLLDDHGFSCGIFWYSHFVIINILDRLLQYYGYQRSLRTSIHIYDRGTSSRHVDDGTHFRADEG